MRVVVEDISLDEFTKTNKKRKITAEDSQQTVKRRKLDTDLKEQKKLNIVVEVSSIENKVNVIMHESLIESAEKSIANSYFSNSINFKESVNTNEAISTVRDSLILPIPKTIARVEFRVQEVVWAKIKGSPHWPAKINSFPSNRTAEVVWFNDYRKTKIFKTQLFKFLVYFDEFAKKFNDTVGLEAAAKEGLMYYGENMLF